VPPEPGECRDRYDPTDIGWLFKPNDREYREYRE
jgi:hypothetical protein